MGGNQLQKAQDDHREWVLAIREKIRGLSDEAVERMVELSKDAESEAVRYQATKDLLDRAGVRAPAQTQHIDIDVAVKQAELAEVNRETAYLLTRLARNHTQEALTRGTPELDTLLVLEGDDEDLVEADPVEGAIEATSWGVDDENEVG